MANGESAELEFVREIRTLADLWQGRALRAALGEKLGLVICSAFERAYHLEVLLTVLQATFPGFRELKAPQLNSYGTIRKDGAIVADIALAYGMSPLGMRYVMHEEKDAVVFDSLGAMQDECRAFADRLRLPDDERTDFFIVMTNWVVADTRLDPNMNPLDPDAKRLTTH